MSTEGVTLLSKVALAAILIMATAYVRVLVGPSKKRGFFMGLGTLGGMATGIAVASLLSSWITTDLPSSPPAPESLQDGSWRGVLHAAFRARRTESLRRQVSTPSFVF